MAFCTQCGTDVTAGSRYCATCGSIVEDLNSAPTQRLRRPSDESIAVGERRLLDTLRQLTLGEYEILGEIGRGGMAVVFVAHDIALDRKVAIKVMSPALMLMDEGIQDRFKREARTAASLSHPHIIPVYSVREAKDLVYFVMKFVLGRSLESVVKDIGALPIPMVQTVLTQAGGALGYAHRHGVVHRDVKPGNIMLDEEGWVVVADFGIAKVAEQRGLTMTGGVVGTPAYMSPEQCSGREITGAADQYSLGVVAYEMITGGQPFEGRTMVTQMYDHCHTKPRPVSELRPDCPPGVADAVMRMLEKEPEERWPSIEDAVAAIGSVSDSQSGTVRTQLLTLVQDAPAAEFVRKFQTPASPVPRTPRSPSPAPPIAPPSSAPTPGTQAPSPRRLSFPMLAVLPVLLTAVAAWALFGRSEAATSAPAESPEPNPPSQTIDEPQVPSVAQLAIRPLSATLTTGERLALDVTASAGDGTTVPSAAVTWEVGDGSVASVSPDGVVTGATAGTTQVSARSGSASASVVVTVEAPPAATRVAQPAPPRATTLRIEPAAGSLTPGETVQLAATVLDQRDRRMTGRAITWATSDPSVLAVSAQGLVRATGEGTAQVTATSDGRTARASFSVAPVLVATLDLRPAAGALEVGESLTLSVTPRDERGTSLSGRVVAWTSSNPNVAAVSSDGTVRGVAPGAATISATSGAGAATTAITVVAPAAPAFEDSPDPRAEVDRLLEQYRVAIESTDLGELRRAYPEMTPDQESAWRGFFSNSRDLSVTFNVLESDVAGDAASARVRATYAFRTNARQERTVVFAAFFERASQGWRLTAIQ